MRYANNSNYKNDTMIRKEAHVSKTVIDELRRILLDSEVRLMAVEQLTIEKLLPSGSCFRS